MMWTPTEYEVQLIHAFHEAMRILDTPTDFEAACVIAHEVRNG